MANLSNYVHPCGTCKMGTPYDASVVVDPHCNVTGIEGLSVIEASVIPIIPRANTHLTAVMIAERAAMLMLQ